jgi:hypothetical protein
VSIFIAYFAAVADETEEAKVDRPKRLLEVRQALSEDLETPSVLKMIPPLNPLPVDPVSPPYLHPPSTPC